MSVRKTPIKRPSPKKVAPLEFKILHPCLAFVAATALSSRYENGFAPGAYTVFFSGPGGRLKLWGYGGIKNTETLYAFGLCDLLEKLDSATKSAPDFVLEVYAKHSGFVRTLTEYVPVWIANGNRNNRGKIPDGFRQWKTLYQMLVAGKLRIAKAEPRGFQHEIAAARRIARQYANMAAEAGAHREVKIYERGMLS